MTSRKRIFSVVLALAAVAVVALLVALTLIELDSPELGRVVLARVGQAAGLRMGAESFRWNLIRGLEITRLQARGALPHGRLELSARRLIVKHRLLPLLTGRIVANQAVLEEADVLLVDRAVPRWKQRLQKKRQRRRRRARRAATAKSATETDRQTVPRAVSARGWQVSIDIVALELTNAHLALEKLPAGERQMELDGLDLSLRDVRFAPGGETPLLDAAAHGRFSFDRIQIGETVAHHADGRLELEDGRLRIERLSLLLPSGRYTVDHLEVDLSHEPASYAVRLSGEALDSGVLLGAGPDIDMGSSMLNFDGSGVGSGLEQLEGEGMLTLSPGSLPPLPMLSTIDDLVGSHLVGTPFDELQIPFRLQGNRILVDSLEIPAGRARLSITGWTDRAGNISARVIVSAPGEQVELTRVPERLLDALTDEDGTIALSFNISGTRTRPRVAPDLPEMSDRSRRELERMLKQELQEKLRSFLQRQPG